MISREKMEQWDREGRIYFPKEKSGRLRRKSFADELRGMPIQNLWADIPELNSRAQERLGYPTQKPVALLERILSASSNEGDVVLDPFCGCGTTVHAAQKLNRQWIGIDITHLAISLIERRLKDAFPGIAFTVEGTPKDLAGARDLALRDKYQFQWWATSLVGAVPAGGKKKGADRGVDGFLNFRDADNKPIFAIVSVKGGDKVSSPMIRDLKGVVEREKAAIGVFITLAPATRDMTTEAAAAGFFETGGKKFPRIQILTIEDLFDGRNVQIPFGYAEGFKKPAREKQDRQKSLF
jgi:site-specific DNA-methyltransferase (adenine-specific)